MHYSRKDAGTTTWLRVCGELDAISAAELGPVLDALVLERRHDVVVDLSELRVLDSTGVGSLLSLNTRVRADGGTVRVIDVTSQPLVVYNLLHLERVFSLPANPIRPAGNAGIKSRIDAGRLER
jgi:anti-sigma B factor antagonist